MLYNLVGNRIESMVNSFLNNSDDGSIIERKLMINLALEYFGDRPIFGHGIYSFAHDFAYCFGREVYSHNNFTEILYCYGIVGFVLFYWKYLFSIKYFKNIFLNDSNITLASIFIVILMSDTYSITFLQPLAIVYISLFMDGLCRNSILQGE